MRSAPGDWPPTDIEGYLHSDRFGDALVNIATDLQNRYRHMDFSDAVAHVYAWFDGKIASDPDFINVEKFRSEQAFIAYLKQAAWNAARMSERQRKRFHEVEAFPIDSSIVDYSFCPELLDPLLDMIERLPYPHKMIFDGIFIQKRDALELAAIFDRDIEWVWKIYEEAIDMLSSMLTN